jgi:hypothetical protein
MSLPKININFFLCGSFVDRLFVDLDMYVSKQLLYQTKSSLNHSIAASVVQNFTLGSFYIMCNAFPNY